MDCKVFVIVDFDNFFPRPIPEIPINKIEFLFKEIVRDIITNVHNVQISLFVYMEDGIKMIL